jgi:hypothetical protein
MTAGLPSGRYWSESKEARPSNRALDDKGAAELWDKSEEWTRAFQP